MVNTKESSSKLKKSRNNKLIVLYNTWNNHTSVWRHRDVTLRRLEAVDKQILYLALAKQLNKNTFIVTNIDSYLHAQTTTAAYYVRLLTNANDLGVQVRVLDTANYVLSYYEWISLKIIITLIRYTENKRRNKYNTRPMTWHVFTYLNIKRIKRPKQYYRIKHHMFTIIIVKTIFHYNSFDLVSVIEISNCPNLFLTRYSFKSVKHFNWTKPDGWHKQTLTQNNYYCMKIKFRNQSHVFNSIYWNIIACCTT